MGQCPPDTISTITTAHHFPASDANSGARVEKSASPGLQGKACAQTFCLARSSTSSTSRLPLEGSVEGRFTS